MNNLCSFRGFYTIFKTIVMDLTPIDPFSSKMTIFSGAYQPIGIILVVPAHPFKYLGLHLTANGDLNAALTPVREISSYTIM